MELIGTPTFADLHQYNKQNWLPICEKCENEERVAFRKIWDEKIKDEIFVCSDCFDLIPECKTCGIKVNQMCPAEFCFDCLKLAPKSMADVIKDFKKEDIKK